MRAKIELWWRDDDAIDDTPELRQMLALRRKWDLPLALAVVPAMATPNLFAAVKDERDIDILVHGYAHRNHAPSGERRSELGPYRPQSEIEYELTYGLARLKSMYPLTLAVLVPPWNNREPELLPSLPDLGFIGVSGWNPRRKLRPVPGLAATCTHIDLFRWREGGRLSSPQEMIAAIEAEVERQQTEGPEPIGLLTHHLRMDERGFANLDALFHWVAADARFFWCAARNIFGCRGTKE